tara:strand:+ start:4195 stop:4563 length:369 start_codon:yes stop_codon:yes gene_type:complete
MARRTKRGISPFYNRITLFFLILAVGFLGLIVFDLFEKEREAAERRANAVREFKDVQEREAVLDIDLAILNTARGQEALVRNTFDVAKEGEEVIVVLDALPATTTPKETSKGLILWFLSLFE